MRRPLAREKQNIKKRELKVRSKCVYSVLMEVVKLPINTSNFSSCTIEMQFWSHLKKVSDFAWGIQKEQSGVFKAVSLNKTTKNPTKQTSKTNPSPPKKPKPNQATKQKTTTTKPKQKR